MIENIGTIIIAVSAFVTAGATIVLAIITWRYVRLTGGLLKATYKPQIVVFLHLRGLIRHFDDQVIAICVENVGQGMARKVRFGGNLSFRFRGGISLETVDFIRNGIDTLAPGQTRRSNLYTFKRSTPDWDGEKHQPVVISVACKDSMGGDHDDEFILDFNDLDLPS